MTYKPISPIEISQRATSLFEKYEVEKAAVFGSCSRNEMKRGSDIDILVEIKDLSNPFVFIELKRKLENLLKRKVDLISFNSLEKSSLRESILTEAQVIYEKRH